MHFTNTSAFAQTKGGYSYNVNRAIDCFKADDYKAAKEFIDKELKDNPKSAIAYDMLGWCYLCGEEYGNALTMYMRAKKYYSKKDKEGLGRSSYYLARTYLCLEDTAAAIREMRKAVAYEPDETRYKEDLADLYCDTEQYSVAEELYLQMLKTAPGSAIPYYGLAQNEYRQGQLGKAKEYVAKSKLLDSSSTMPSTLMMRIHMLEQDYKSAITEAINVLSAYLNDNEAYNTLFCASDSAYQTAVNALTKKSFEDSENHTYWEYVLGCMLCYHNDYKKAIKTLQPLVDEDTNAKSVALEKLIDCYYELGNSRKMLELCDILSEEYEIDAEYTIKRGVAKFKLGMLKEARLDFEAGMKLDKDYGYYCFYRIGWIEETLCNYEAALEYYDKSIALDDSYAYIYMMKGNLLNDYLNSPDEARKCFEMCIEVEGSAITDDLCRQYAYVGLGNSEKAIEITDSIINAYPDKPGVYYDAACVYCRLGNKEKGLHYLQTAFDKGYCDVPHVVQDNDMDLIRDTEEFRAMVEKYSERYRISDEPSSAVPNDSEEKTSIHEIPIVRKSSNTYLIKASINNLPMDFILDTGCSDISLSSVESEFMLKNGYLKPSDFKGKARYSNATGETHTAQEIIIREIRLGDLVLNNLKASVIPNQKAPLLLGQCVLTKFGKVEIDHNKKVLRIENNERLIK